MQESFFLPSHHNFHINNRAVKKLIFRWSSSVLNPEAARDVIWLEESGTMSLNDSVNQFNNVIDPVIWKDSNFSLVNISVKWEWTQSWLCITAYKGYNPSHTWLQCNVRSIIDFVLCIASHKYWLKFDNSGPAEIWTRISGIKSDYITIVLRSIYTKGQFWHFVLFPYCRPDGNLKVNLTGNCANMCIF